MKIIEQSHKIESMTPEPLLLIERAARTCYKSEGRIADGSAEMLITKLIKRGHEAMLEHAMATVRFVTDRGVSHELVRHRLASFAQESTRYVKYDGDMEFIKPVWLVLPQDDIVNIDAAMASADREMVVIRDGKSGFWYRSCKESERTYKDMIHHDAQPQEARQVLNNSVKTEIVVTANFREWRHIFALRTAPAAHPQMRALMLPLLSDFRLLVPIIFDDVEVLP